MAPARHDRRPVQRGFLPKTRMYSASPPLASVLAYRDFGAGFFFGAALRFAGAAGAAS
jgi:hypothetical protein